MNLKDINFKISYRSENDDLLNDFYLPALTASKEYYRAAGFFSNSLLNELGKGLYPFISNLGTIKLVCGFQFTENDLAELEIGYEARKASAQQRISESILAELEKCFEYRNSNLSNVCWMLANNRLEIKIAFKISESKVRPGIYHEKIGIFFDQDDNIIATQGSSNETEYGYVNNFEYFDVYKSWAGDDQLLRVQQKVKIFNRLWSDKTNNLVILDFPVVAKERLIKHAPKVPVMDDVSQRFLDFINKKANKIEEVISPRPYQTEIIDSWFVNKCKGIFEMATGTGKTYTALFGVRRYIKEKKGRYVLVICCPFQHLVDQWEKSVRDVFENVEIIKCYDSKKKWFGPLNKLLQNIIFGTENFGVIITTTDTGSSESFINIVNTPKIAKIVIGDEVHNMGSEHNKNFFSIDSLARIGLSATPIRPYDEEGNQEIEQYFGLSIEPTIGIREAIEQGFLVPYNYFVRFCDMDDIDYEEYKKISIRIAQLYSSKVNDPQKLQILLIRRARIISSCSSKIKVFSRILDEINNHSNLLVYTAEDPEFFEHTLDILQEKNIKTLSIIANVDKCLRTEIIEKFANKDVDCLLAMRCLDEGVDIPSAEKAIILASSTNEKQYIQRRGRVLRKDKTEKKKFADIYDIIVVPPAFTNEIDKSLFEREIRRVLEFASSARNGLQVVTQIKEFARDNILLKNFTNIFKEF